MNLRQRNLAIGGACTAFIAVASLFPYWLRINSPNMMHKDKLNGSQRQRGLYLNAGSSDAGVDPDWDPVQNKWRGFEKLATQDKSSVVDKK